MRKPRRYKVTIERTVVVEVEALSERAAAEAASKKARIMRLKETVRARVERVIPS